MVTDFCDAKFKSDYGVLEMQDHSPIMKNCSLLELKIKMLQSKPGQSLIYRYCMQMCPTDKIQSEQRRAHQTEMLTQYWTTELSMSGQRYTPYE